MARALFLLRIFKAKKKFFFGHPGGFSRTPPNPPKSAPENNCLMQPCIKLFELRDLSAERSSDRGFVFIICIVLVVGIKLKIQPILFMSLSSWSCHACHFKLLPVLGGGGDCTRGGGNLPWFWVRMCGWSPRTPPHSYTRPSEKHDPFIYFPYRKLTPFIYYFWKLTPFIYYFFKFYPFIYFSGEKDTPLIYFWCKNDTHSYTGRPEKYTPFQPHICIYLYNGSYPAPRGIAWLNGGV